MKYIFRNMQRGLVLLIMGIWAASSYADIGLTCNDYDYVPTICKGGSVVVVPDPSNECRWTLTAVKSSVGRFVGWTLDNTLVTIVDGTTSTPTIKIELIDPTLRDSIPCNAQFVYSVMHCNTCGDYDIDTIETVTYPHEADNMAQSTHENWRGTIRATQPDGECWQINAVPKTGYTFAQWSDGWAYNPRTIDIIDKDTVTYYATFISTSIKGTIDSWGADQLVVKTTEAQGALGVNPAYYAIVYYDGQPVGTASPTEFDPGVYYVDAAYSSAADLAGKTVHIVYKTDDCIPIATLDATIPYLVSDEENVAKLSSDGRAKYGVHVLDGGVATFAESQDIADLDIYAGGKVVVDADVEATSVTLRSDPVNYIDAGELLIGTGRLTNTNGNIIYFDCALDYYDYYPFSLPATISTSDATYRSGEDAGEHYVLSFYDGDQRARKSTNPSLSGWADYYDLAADGKTKVISIGRGYNIFSDPLEWNEELQEMYGGVIRFPMPINLSSGAMSAKTIEVEQNDASGTAETVDKNWNLIGSPYLSSYRGNIMMLDADDNEVDYLNYIIYSEDHYRSYPTAVAPSSFTIKPFDAYFVQVPDGVYKLRFDAPLSGRTYAPRRAIMNTSSKLTAGLTLTQGDKSDRTGLLIGEQYTNDYDINADLVKMMGSKQGLSVFSIADNQKLAYIALPFAEGLSTQETVIPLGYSKATVGSSMTFAFDEERYPSVRDDERIQALNLIDYAEGSMTDLLQDSYTCTATEAASNARFALAIRYVKNGSNVATGICNEATPTKMRDGVYDLMGRRVNMDDARTLGAGVYVIIENGKARKEVIR